MMNTLPELLREDVESICYKDGRKVGSAGHERARKRLGERLREIGCEPYAGDSLELPYTNGGLAFCNLAGRIVGSDRNLPPLLIGAHYDSVIAHPCADDNAAAVAIALHAARLLHAGNALKRGLIVAIFDAEEPPYFQTGAMGSNRFYEDHVQGKTGVHAALVMDLVGHDVSLPLGGMNDDSTLRSLLFVTGCESHPEMAEIAGAIGQPKGLKVVPTLNAYVDDMSDHGAFRQHGVPYYFLSCGHWVHYHRPTDTPDRLNYEKMAAITYYVMELLTHLDSRQLAGRGPGERTHDTLKLESAFMRDAFGPFFDPLMKWAGVPNVDARANMDRFVHKLVSAGL